MAKIICITVNTVSNKEYHNILSISSRLGFINFIIISSETHEIKVTALKSFQGDLVTYNSITDVKTIFSDHLKNLNGYKYRIAVFSQPPQVLVDNSKLRAPLTHFINTIADIQNTSVDYIILRQSIVIKNYWINREMDLTLNTAFSFPISPYPKLLTYDETAYCALTPANTKYELHEFILLHPFDSLTWMLLMLTLVLSMTVWKIFQGRGAVDTHWIVGAGITATFINQSVNFSNRNHAVLNVLFHLIVFLIFVLSNAYEGSITSFMIQPPKDHRLDTFDQILTSGYEIMTDEVFADIVKSSQEFMAVKSRINDTLRSFGRTFGTEAKRQHFVFVLKCDQAEYKLQQEFESGEKVSDYYYLLSERIMKNFIRLEASYMNPFIDRIQYYMDLSFQAGLTQIWKTLTSRDVLINQYIPAAVEQQLLDFNSIKTVFGILIFGLGMSFIVLLVEIFFHNFLRSLSFKSVRKQMRNKMNQMAYKKKKTSNINHKGIKKVKRL